VHVRFRPQRLTLLCATALLPALAQTTPSGLSAPMDDYLGLLARIAPAAHDGARAYLEAHRRRCGRELTSAELRIAMTAGDGDRVLMSMIRASHARDTSAMAALGGQVHCRRTAP
jgi:hypothetical protein